MRKPSHSLPNSPFRASGRSKSVSQASVAGYDSDSVELQALEDSLEAQYYHGQNRPREPSPYERRNWGLRKQAIQNWQRRPYRNSTEGEEGDVSDVASRTTESEAEMWEQERRAECQQHCPHRSNYRLGTGNKYRKRSGITNGRPLGLSSVRVYKKVGQCECVNVRAGRRTARSRVT